MIKYACKRYKNCLSVFQVEFASNNAAEKRSRAEATNFNLIFPHLRLLTSLFAHKTRAKVSYNLTEPGTVEDQLQLLLLLLLLHLLLLLLPPPAPLFYVNHLNNSTRRRFMGACYLASRIFYGPRDWNMLGLPKCVYPTSPAPPNQQKTRGWCSH